MDPVEPLHDNRRAIGQHIGAALRYARAAAELNLSRAPLDAVRHQAGLALDVSRKACDALAKCGALTTTNGGAS